MHNNNVLANQAHVVMAFLLAFYVQTWGGITAGNTNHLINFSCKVDLFFVVTKSLNVDSLVVKTQGPMFRCEFVR